MRCDSVPTILAPVQKNIEPTPQKKTATKWKSAMEPSGDEVVEVEGKSKRRKANEPLILQQYVTMLASDIEKLDKAKQTKMKNLYSQAFESLYKWGHKKLKDDKGKEVSVYFLKLHKAPHSSIVY